MLQAVLTFLSACLAYLAGTGGPLHTMYLGLFIQPSGGGSPPVLGPDTQLSDLTEPTASDSGYRRIACPTFSAPAYTSDGKVSLVAESSVQFRPSANMTSGYTALGWFLASDATAGSLLAAANFSAPVPMLAQTDQATIVPIISLDPAASLGGALTDN